MKRVAITRADDITGEHGAAPVRFGLGGAAWEIDLAAAGRAALAAAYAPYVAAARPRPPRRARTPADRRSAAARRRWAEKEGLVPPGGRGRLAAGVLRAWREAGSPALPFRGDEPWHGTAYGYGVHQCHCAPCSDAGRGKRNSYRAARRARKEEAA